MGIINSELDRERKRVASLEEELERYRLENKRLRSALAMIREITGQDSVWHEADSALAGQGGEGWVRN